MQFEEESDIIMAETHNGPMSGPGPAGPMSDMRNGPPGGMGRLPPGGGPPFMHHDGMGPPGPGGMMNRGEQQAGNSQPSCCGAVPWCLCNFAVQLGSGKSESMRVGAWCMPRSCPRLSAVCACFHACCLLS